MVDRPRAYHEVYDDDDGTAAGNVTPIEDTPELRPPGKVVQHVTLVLGADGVAVDVIDHGTEVTLFESSASVPLPSESSASEPAGLYLPPDFWAARDYLARIRDAAYARQRSPDALLHIVLARVAASIPHTIRIPAIVGSDAALCYFCALCDLSGAGKSSVNPIGENVIPATRDLVDQVPLGSGEGIIEVLFEMVNEPDPKNPDRTVRVKRQTKHNVYMFVDEGAALAALEGRSGATLFSHLRSLWVGQGTGSANASEERRRILPAGTYTYGLIVNLQPKSADLLLRDIHAGTPQRFMWVLASHPDIPPATGEIVETLGWTPPDAGKLARIRQQGGGYVRHFIDVDDVIVKEVRDLDLLKARGQYHGNPLDAHAMLYRLKIAGLLAILDGRLDINGGDWQLAEQVLLASTNVRAYIGEQVATLHQETEKEKHEALARRDIYVSEKTDAAREQRYVIEAAKVTGRAVWKAGGLGRGETRARLKSNRRYLFDDALDHAIAEGWVVEITTEHGSRIEPGKTRP